MRSPSGRARCSQRVEELALPCHEEVSSSGRVAARRIGGVDETLRALHAGEPADEGHDRRHRAAGRGGAGRRPGSAPTGSRCPVAPRRTAPGARPGRASSSSRTWAPTATRRVVRRAKVRSTFTSARVFAGEKYPVSR